MTHHPSQDPEHRRDLSDSRDGQEAPPDGIGASASTAEIIPLQRPKTYLDACREQGVHQELEELRDENAKLTAKNNRRNAAQGEDLAKAGVAVLGDHNPGAATFALNEQRERMQARLQSMVEVIGASPLAGSWFPTFALMLLDEEEVWTPEVAASYLAACLQQDTKSTAPTSIEPDEPVRLNGEGLHCRSS